MSLRARLVIGLLALVTVGLVAFDLLTYTALRSFVLGRVDSQLLAARQPVAQTFNRQVYGGVSGNPFAPAGLVAYVVDDEGTVVLRDVGRRQGFKMTLPKLDVDQRDNTELFDIEASDGRYRMVASALDGGGALVIGLPRDDVDSTLRRLVGIELVGTTALLVALGALGLAVVRIGLRPLEEIERTASEIAAGDLSARVPEAPPSTEVGRLGAALNTMLGRIEVAFDERAASEERLRRFVGDASHELRTPLTAIRGWAELFRRGAAERPADLATAMRRIEDESARMSVLVDDLLLLARLDQGRPLERGPVDLSRLAADAVADAHAVDPTRSVTLDAPLPVVVEGDDARLRQVVGNLVANARAHTPAATPILVAVRQHEGVAQIAVVDRGQGIPEDERAKVFERFYRADPSRTRASGGSGLGLSIVAAIAEAHGGSAAASETAGGGTTVTITIPLVVAAPPVVDPVATLPPWPSSSSPPSV